MGVTLERVQFKFASIIGELCSEPVVLSQFAVWLDLRLAEYKSKGAISLDCSGEKPDPSWLKGLRAANPPMAKRVLGSRLAPRPGVGFSRGGMYSRSSAFHRRNMNSHSRLSHSGLAQSPHSQPGTPSDNNNRLSGGEVLTGAEQLGDSSDDIVVIKDEPSEDSAVFPVSLHSHQSNEPESRKRPSRDSVSGEMQDNSSSPYKVLKSQTDDSPLNQSLMSVLGSTFDDQKADGSVSGANDSSLNEMDYSVSLQDQTGDSASFQSWADNSTHSTGPHTSSTTTYSPTPGPSTSATVTSNSSLAEGSISADTEQAETNVTTESADPLWMQMISRPGDLSVLGDGTPVTDPVAENRRRRGRINMEGKPRCTISDIVAAVGSFERWLWALPGNYHREIFQISPGELDQYLVLFFSSVKSRTGKDYTPESFKNLRSRLDTYLRDNHYPCSITKSKLFSKSQLAYKLRRKQLAESGASQTTSSSKS